jgi:hypothetical protein
MPLIKETIRYNNQDMNLKIKLSTHDAFTGYQQEIDNLTQITTASLINPVNDNEMRRFKHYTDVNTTLRFQFYNSTLDMYFYLFAPAGFTPVELATKSFSALNSFFMLEYFDSYDIYNQNKIFATYLTKIGVSPSYTINPTSDNQFYRWYVPISYIDSQTGTTVTGYTKFSFYNAKRGKIHVFYNQDNESLSSAERMYFKTRLNLINRTWEIVTPSFPIITGKELKYTTYQQYTDRVNDTIDNFENLTQSYPSGNTFNYIEGNYLTK